MIPETDSGQQITIHCDDCGADVTTTYHGSQEEMDETMKELLLHHKRVTGGHQ